MLIPRELHALRTQAAAAQHACHVAVAAYHAAATTRTPTRLLRDQALSCRAAGDQSALTLLGDYLDQGAAEPNPSMERAQVQHGLDLVHQQLNRLPPPPSSAWGHATRAGASSSGAGGATHHVGPPSSCPRSVSPIEHGTHAAGPARHRPRSARQGGAVTQRRATTTRSPRVGKQLADLPSGERAKKRVWGWRRGRSDAGNLDILWG